MKILFATSELAPWVKTGGLGDVAAALPTALAAAGHEVRLLVPAYPALKAAFPDAPMVAVIPAGPGALPAAALREARLPSGLMIYLLEHDAYFERKGNPYLGPEGLDWLDNAFRFGLLSHTAALLASGTSPVAWVPEILHCNDWQTGLAPAYLHYVFGDQSKRAKSVLTVHNLAFQGLFGRDLLSPLGLPEHAWAMDGVEYHGYLSFLKAGLQFADALTTVSPRYAREIQTIDEGMGLDGLLRYRAAKLTGIVNGIDTEQWNPETDPLLPARYSASDLSGKANNAAALRREMGLRENFSGPLLGIVSRLTAQKGLDLLPELAESLAALPVQLAVLGNGNQALEAAFKALAVRYPGQFAVRIGFDEGLAHRIEAGADFFLMPSRFEPCGLNQLYSLRYGTPPIVRATGGLADTVIDASNLAQGNGFVFQEATSAALWAAIVRAVALWQDKKAYVALQRRAMAADFSWTHPAQATAAIYQGLLRRNDLP